MSTKQGFVTWETSFKSFLLATCNTTLLCRIVMLNILKSIVVDYLDRVYTVPVQLLIRNRSWYGSKVITLLRCGNCTRQEDQEVLRIARGSINGRLIRSTFRYGSEAASVQCKTGLREHIFAVVNRIIANFKMKRQNRHMNANDC